jgi:hypothetical protein
MGRQVLPGGKMNQKMIPLDYANSLIYEMEKAFWDERGKGARFRMTTVGREFYKDNCLPLFTSAEVEHLIETIGKVLEEKKIVSSVSYVNEDRLFKIKVKGCIHKKVEDQMLAKGIEPFTCIPANLIVLAIEEKLDRPVELAEIKVEDGACQLLLILFEKRPAIN